MLYWDIITVGDFYQYDPHHDPHFLESRKALAKSIFVVK